MNYLPALEFDANHELNLPRQARTRIWRGRVVVVVIEIVCRGDDTEISGDGQVCATDRGVVRQGKGARVAELNMVQDVEYLRPKLHGNTFGEFGCFHQRQIDLPAIQSADEAVRRISKTSEEALRVYRRRRERRGIDQRHSVVSTSRQSQRHARHYVRPLIVLVVTVGKKIGVGQAGGEERVVGILYVAAEIHLNGQRMTGMPQPDATQLPASDNLPQHPGILQKSLARSEGEFVHGVQSEILPNIEDAWRLVASEAVDILRTRRLAAANRSVVNRVRPGVAGLEGKAILHAVFER